MLDWRRDDELNVMFAWKGLLLMRKLLTCLTIAVAVTAFGWPKLDEFEKVKPVVAELLSVKEKEPPAKAAEDVVSLADDAETEAAKFLLLRRAVELYARAGDDAKAADTFKRLLGTIQDVPATVQERILLDAGRTLV